MTTSTQRGWASRYQSITFPLSSALFPSNSRGRATHASDLPSIQHCPFSLPSTSIHPRATLTLNPSTLLRAFGAFGLFDPLLPLNHRRLNDRRCEDRSCDPRGSRVRTYMHETPHAPAHARFSLSFPMQR